MVVNVEFIKSEYPLHWLVWHDDYKQLDVELIKNEFDKEKLDNRGRTPLMLAVTLGHVESVRTLLNREANVNCENCNGWSVVQEAVSTGDPELLHMVLERRDVQQYSNRMAGIPELLQKLKEAPDFYVEMKWEFTSWVPLMSRMCPSDTYKVYKRGSSVRIDTTLLGFDQNSWQRGNKTYVFQGHSEGATMMEIDHEKRQIYTEEMRTSEVDVGILMTTAENVAHRLTNPIVTTYVDTDKINFERNKSGVWGWRSDKIEPINGHECKVFSATNVELITKTRTEHLTADDKARSMKNTAFYTRSPLQNIFGIAEIEAPPTMTNDESRRITTLSSSASVLGISDGIAANSTAVTSSVSTHSLAVSGSGAPLSNFPANRVTNGQNPSSVTVEEYFDKEQDLGRRDIGRSKEVTCKVQKFRANLWLCEDYPLSLPEQILPIVDLMAISSSHFAKLRDFIQLQLPAGFPVKIEIPLFHVFNARITFGNIFGMDTPTVGVERVHVDQDCDQRRLTCILDDDIFQCPTGYTNLAEDELVGRRQYGDEEEDDLLQFAIQQSLIDAGTEKEEVDIWEALKSQKPNSRPPSPPQRMLSTEDSQLQRAIQASLELYQNSTNANPAINKLQNVENGQNPIGNDDDPDSDLRRALLLSVDEERKIREEQEREEQLLRDALQLSLTDK